MGVWLKNLLTAPVFEDEDQTRAARLLHVMSRSASPAWPRRPAATCPRAWRLKGWTATTRCSSWDGT